jgi:hypothetical protein
VHEPPPIQRQHDQHVQRAERHRRHGQEVDGRRFVQVVLQKRLPVLCRSPASLEHVAGDRGFADVVAEHHLFGHDRVTQILTTAGGSRGHQVATPSSALNSHPRLW